MFKILQGLVEKLQSWQIGTQQGTYTFVKCQCAYPYRVDYVLATSARWLSTASQSYGWWRSLKVSKFQKQIFLFSFEPKNEKKSFFDFCPNVVGMSKEKLFDMWQNYEFSSIHATFS